MHQIEGFDGVDFNPRSPWGERLLMACLARPPIPFQSTLPVGGATWDRNGWMPMHGFQSTLPVGGATFVAAGILWKVGISIHAPRGGSDQV